MKKVLIIITFILSGILLLGCNDRNMSHDIYVTVYPLQYVAEEILEGTEYTVGIVPGVTSHESSVDWSPREIIAMTEATYLFYIGANYDYYIDYQIDSIFSNKLVELVKIQDSGYIEFIPGEIHEQDHDDEHTHDAHTTNTSALGIDPHFWISPIKILEVAELVYDKLIEAYPEEDTLLSDNYDNLLLTLQELSDDYQEAIDKLTNIVLTSTNLYGYLRNDYGLNFMPISTGYHEESDQFTLEQKQKIVAEADFHNIQYIIYEKYTTSPLSDAVREELSMGKLEFNILQSILDEEVNAGKNYVTIMYDNLELIKTAGEYEG
jgi:zinc transport system substrate-binding protein